MKYVVIKDRGNQYKVAEGEELLVPLFQGDVFEPEVLLCVDEENILVGTPKLTKVKTEWSIVKKEEKGTKIHVFKYKSKSRYRKNIGARAHYTRVKLVKLS